MRTNFTHPLVTEARETNRRCDVMDARAGFASPGQGDFLSDVRTAMMALAAAITNGEWDTVAEAYVILETAVNKTREG